MVTVAVCVRPLMTPVPVMVTVPSLMSSAPGANSFVSVPLRVTLVPASNFSEPQSVPSVHENGPGPAHVRVPPTADRNTPMNRVSVVACRRLA